MQNISTHLYHILFLNALISLGRQESEGNKCGCVAVCLCVCAGSRVCGSVAVLLCGCVGLWVGKAGDGSCFVFLFLFYRQTDILDISGV